MRVVHHLMLRTPIAVASFIGATLFYIVAWLPTGIARHSRPVVGSLAPTHSVAIVKDLGRPLVLALRVKIFSLVPFPLIPSPFTIVFIFLFHCPFHVHSGVIHVFIGDTLVH